MAAEMISGSYPTATDSNDLSSMMEAEYPTIDLDDLDFFASHSAHDDSAISVSATESLASRQFGATDPHTTANSLFNSPRLQSQTNQAFLPASQAALDQISSEETELGEEEDRLNCLLDIQSRLAKLVKSLSNNRNVPNVEETYQASEALISIMDSFQEPGRLEWSVSSQKPSGAIALLFSSCYLSLIHAYDLLAGLLREQLQTNQHAISKEKAPASGRSMIDSTSGSMPTISVGGVRLAMPTKAVAEINLHLITQMVKQLKDSMQQCAARMSTADTLNLDPPRPASHAADGNADSPITILAKTAEDELRRREENLLGRLRNTGFSDD
jgi:hypothetical protein